jgi:5-methylcytosine-specific restriction protein A
MKNNKEEPSWCKMYRDKVLKPKFNDRFTERKGRTEASQKGWYNTPEWKVTRDKRKKNNPICQRCESKGYIRPMNVVDHIIPVDERPDLFLEYDNTQSLCDTCHIIKTNEDTKRKKKKERLEKGRLLMKKFEAQGG